MRNLEIQHPDPYRPSLLDVISLVAQHARVYAHVRGSAVDSFQAPDGEWYAIVRNGSQGPFIRKSSTGEVLAVGHEKMWLAANFIFGLKTL